MSIVLVVKPRYAVFLNIFFGLGSCLKAVLSFKCVYSSANRAHFCVPQFLSGNACLQTRNVAETNQCPSAVCISHHATLSVVPRRGRNAGGPFWSPRCWPAEFSLGERLAGVRLVVGWCLAVVSMGWAREPRPQATWLQLVGGCLCGGPTGTIAKGRNSAMNSTRHRMWHCPVMLVTAMALTTTAASAVGAIRLCASAA